ncbi:Aldehyde/histidinol dehydrogenase [Russula aff. rugulosa BPL654]|nr:Aldehyde/histidinol dehydrogenase [Russula aff. rugulosa BPL654]
MSSTTFDYKFTSEAFKRKVGFSTGVFINGGGSEGNTSQITSPRLPPNSKREGTRFHRSSTTFDVNSAVHAAKKAFKDTWVSRFPVKGGQHLTKLASLMEQNFDELAAIEALNNARPGTTLAADKIHGQVIETQENNFSYTGREPFGVVGQIRTSLLGPALATGNCVLIKPSEFTPLTVFRMCSLIKEAGFPPGVVNVVTGLGSTEVHLKVVTLDLGGKSPNIAFEDADLGLDTRCAGSRIFVHPRIYDEFLKRFTEVTKSLTGKAGDAFAEDTCQCLQVSENQFYRTQGFWVQSTIITNTQPNTEFVNEEIFGPVAIVIKFKDEDDIGLLFHEGHDARSPVANKVQAGTVWVNCINSLYPNVPYGGVKQSGIGRECDQYALDTCVIAPFSILTVRETSSRS